MVSVLDQRPRGRGFESAGCHVATVGQLLFAPWAWAYSTLHPLGVGNEYWLQLGRYKAGTCDAALCAPCTWAPLRFVTWGAISSALPLPLCSILHTRRDTTKSRRRTKQGEMQSRGERFVSLIDLYYLTNTQQTIKNILLSNHSIPKPQKNCCRQICNNLLHAAVKA